MGCSPSSLAVVELNRSLKTSDGTQSLQDKLHTCPWLLSAATPVLSSTAGTPLHTACERKQVEVVQQMLSFLSSASLPVVREALQPYCRRHGLAFPGSVAEGVHVALDMTNCKGQTPLMCACAAGSPELVKLLLAQGADPWFGDRCGSRTALHYAAMSGSASCIEALMNNLTAHNMARHGVRYVNVRSLCGITALHYAVFFDHTAAVEELLRHDPHLTAASSSHSYDLFVTCDTLSTPLHFAAARGNLEIARQLLRHHVSQQTRTRDPRLQANHSHQLPWQVAAAQHTANRDLVRLLHPGRRLEEALGMSAGAGAGASLVRVGPASLVAIAAAALQMRLMADLERLQGQEAASGSDCAIAGWRNVGSAAAAVAAMSTEPLTGVPANRQTSSAFTATIVPGWGAGSAESSPPVPISARQLSQSSKLPAPGGGCGKAVAATAAVEGSCGEVEDDQAAAALCGVCFAERVAVAPRGCGHGVCGQCAAQMCRLALEGGRPRPLLCPFCRKEVAGFVAAGACRGASSH